MRVLGIESSCDETGIAIYDQDFGLMAHALYSQIDMHAAYGGVVPELASRDHIRRILPLIDQTLKDSHSTLQEIDAIACTIGPGLAGALLVGSAVAHAIGFALDKKVIGIHHLEGHLLSPMLSKNKPEFPFVALLVSGGHTQLMAVNGLGQYTILGETLDDSAGEAFDKTAKLLGLNYPGGPEVSRLAQQGDPTRFIFGRPMLHSKDLDFSFSGLKTAVLTQTLKLQNQTPTPSNGSNASSALTEQDKCDLARGFVDATIDVLSKKALSALKQTHSKRLVVAGGVGANLQLRARLQELAQRHKFELFFPELHLCTDNGAMIAYAGYLRLCGDAINRNEQQTGSFSVHPKWPLNDIAQFSY